MGARIAFYKPHRKTDILGHLVCWWTKSPYSHCEIVLDDWCYSSSIRDGGVRFKKIDLTQKHWVVVPAEDIQPEKVLALYARTKGNKYGLLDCITTQILNTPLHVSGQYFCSEWCAEAAGLPYPEAWKPGMLAEKYGA
jgi:hypothetical protein